MFMTINVCIHCISMHIFCLVPFAVRSKSSNLPLRITAVQPNSIRSTALQASPSVHDYMHNSHPPTSQSHRSTPPPPPTPPAYHTASHHILQVKVFGSFVSGLSLPGSDLDMVICLPNVHTEAAPEAPGGLEGRNSIKESWQQVCIL